MKCILHALVLFATIHGVIAAPTPAQQQREGTATADGPILDAMRDDIIVRAEVVQLLGYEGGMAVTRQKIVHHYSGQLQNADDTFVMRSGIPAGGGTISGGGSLRICPELEVGEETIWVLRLQDESLRVTTGGKFGTKWPGRRVPQCSGAASFGSHGQEDESQPNFAAVEQLAERAEAVWTVDREESRLKLVIEAMKSDVPEVAQWGASVLSNAYPDQMSGVPSETLHDVLSRTIVVRAQVIERDGDEHYGTTTQRIEHVYCGELPENVTTFVDSYAMESSTGGPVWPALEVGQEGLWLLRPTPTGEGVRRKAIGQLGLPWPVRPEIDPRYEQVLQLARALETVWKAETEANRVELLREYARSDVPEVAVGATMLLAEGVPKEFTDYVAKVNLHSLPLSAQIAIDQSMSQVESAKWIDSKKRRDLLEHWGEAAADDASDALAVLSRLRIAIQRKKIAPTQYRQLIEPMATEAYPEQVRLRAIAALRWVMNSDSERDAVLDLLIALVDGEHPDRIQLQAAYTISTLKNASGLQLARLAVLRDKYMQLAHQQPPSDPNEPPRKQSAVKQIADMLDQAVRRLQRQERNDD